MSPAPAALPRPPALVLFDLDGTLADTHQDLGAAANHVRGTQGQPPLAFGNYRRAASGGARGLLRVGLGITPEHADFPAHRDAFLAHYDANLAVHTRPFAGVEELLARLEALGIPWGVATNKPARYTQKLVAALGWQARLSACLSADDVPNPKPAPDMLLAGCARVGADPARAWYVGDDLRDIEAARRAGCASVAAGWGYEGEHPLADWRADATAATPAEFTAWLA